MDSAIVSYVLSYGGAAGLTLLLVLFGFLVPKPYHERVIEQNRKLEEANATLRDALELSQEAQARLSSGTKLNNQLLDALLTLAGGRRNPPDPGADP